MHPSFSIDAHHHLWRYTPAEFGWIDEGMMGLRRDFSSEEFELLAQQEGIGQSIVVQSRPCLAENDFLLACAADTRMIAGVVGWAPLCDKRISQLLETYALCPAFVGVREMVQSESAGYLDQSRFDDGLRELTARNLAYDLLIRADQLEEATRLVDRHPEQRFVLDHAAKPSLRNGMIEPWATDLRGLARRANVSCKLSGFATEAEWNVWTLETLRPYLDLCVDAFGPTRLMAGSDWPVCLLATNYSRWWSTLDEYFVSFSASERAAVFAGTAQEAYRLGPHPSGGSLAA